MRVVVYGAGGHGREVVDVLRSRSDVKLDGFIDDNADLHGSEIGGLQVLGELSALKGANVQVVIAVGRPALMEQLVGRVIQKGHQFANAVSGNAYISATAKIGTGVMIFPQAVVQPDVRIEDHVTLNVSATVSHDSVVGRFANINPGAHVAGNVRVGEGAFVGMGANVIQGVKIGEWATIGAGAVVIGDIPPYATAVGVPAKVIKQREFHRRA